MSFHQNPLAGEGKGGFRVWSWQYHVASIGISVTWFINMILVGKVPKLGIYIHMFLAVGSREGDLIDITGTSQNLSLILFVVLGHVFSCMP